MDSLYPLHQFSEGAATQVTGLSSQDCQLVVVQEPMICKVSAGKEKDRKPVDPPPVVQLKVSPLADPNQNYLQSSHFFLTCSLLGFQTPALSGTIVSSLHRLKDLDNKEGAFFVFGDVSIKMEGTYQLQFNLYEMQEAEECVHICTTISQPFPVVSSKNFHGMPESTGLTRTFSEQGVRLRLRKEPRSLLKPKGPATDDYKPRHYRTNPRTQISHGETLPSPVSSNGSHFSQGLPLDATETQIQNSYTQPLKQLSRAYTTSNDQPHVIASNYEERVTKRPRTGSEHSHLQAYGLQNQIFDSSTYQTIPNFTTSSISGFTPLQQYGTISYASPSMKSMYMPLRGSIQRSFSYSDGSSQFPDNSRFLSQPQVISNQNTYMGSQMSDRQHTDADYSSTTFGSRSFTPQHMGIVPVIPSDWRTPTDSTYQSLSNTSGTDDRQIYGAYQNNHSTTSAS